MTNDDIIQMAKESKVLATVEIAEFAKKVAAYEREACAKVCEALRPFGPELALQKATAEDCAAAIRVRGNQ